MYMRKSACAAAAVLMCAPLWAAEPADQTDRKQVYLLIDETIEGLQGQVYGSPYGMAIDLGLQAAGGHTYVGPSVSNAPVPMSYGQAAAAGIVGGLIAGAIIESAAQSARNKQIEQVSTLLDEDDVLRRRVLGSVSRSFEAAGHALDKRIVVRNPDEKLIKRAIGRERPEEIILFASKNMPVVVLSTDNRRVMVQAKVSLYLHDDGRDYDLDREHDVMFVSPPSPEGVDPLEYWAHDRGHRVLEAVETGIAHLVAAATMEETRHLAELGEDERVELMLDGERVAMNGRHLGQHGDYAYLLTPGDWVRVWPASLAPAAIEDAVDEAVPAVGSAPQ